MESLGPDERITLGGGLALVVAVFLPWYRFDLGVITVDVGIFDSAFSAWGGTLVALGGAVVIAAGSLANRRIGTATTSPEQLASLLGLIGFGLVAIRLLTQSRGRSFGLFLAVLGAGAVAYGTFRISRAAAR